MVEIADIVPSAFEDTDRLLVRRGSGSPYDLDLLSNVTPGTVRAAAQAAQNIAAPVISGRYLTTSRTAANFTSNAFVAGRLFMVPFYVGYAATINEVGINVIAPGASAEAQCVIYKADANGAPGNLFFAGASNLDCSTAGYKAHSASFTFNPDTYYWAGFRCSVSISMSAINVADGYTLGARFATNTGQETSLQRVSNFVDPAPSTFGTFFSGGGSSPVIFFRVV